MSRKDLGLSEKIAILDSIKAEPNRSSRRLAEITGISKSSILRILRDETRLRTLWASENRRDVKRYRESKCPEVDEALRKWFSDIGSRNESLSGSVLMKKAEQLALELGKNDFRATDGWLSRWKQRHCIKFKRTPADVSTANQWRSLRIPEILQSFSADDIYNAAETSLFHRQEHSFGSSLDLLPTSTEKSKDRLTVLCCTNMSGSDKRQLLIIGHSVEPICINEFKLENFQFSFHANNNARLTTPIFSSWLTAWDEELQRTRRRVLLLIDDCVPRPPRDSLKNIVFEFLPTNITSKIQPLSMGIIDNLKTMFNAKMADAVTQAIEPNLLMPSPELNMMQAALIAADSWKNVSQTLIQDCFAQSGLKQGLALEHAPPLIEFPPDPGMDRMPSLISAGNSEESAPRESWISNANGSKNEEVVADEESSTGQAQGSGLELNPVPSLITSGNSEESAPCESWIPKAKLAGSFEFVLDAESFLDREHGTLRTGDNSENAPVRPDVSKIEALECLERVKRYFAQGNRRGCPYAELETCMKFVLDQDRGNS